MKSLVYGLAICAIASNASALDVTFVDSVPKQNFIEVCASNFPDVDNVFKICEESQKSLEEMYQNAENEYYTVFAEINGNTENIETNKNCHKSTHADNITGACFPNKSDEWVFMAPKGYRMDMEALSDIKIRYQVIGYKFSKTTYSGSSPHKYGNKIFISVLPKIRKTIELNNETLLDTQLNIPISFAKVSDCSVAKKPHKCIRRNDEYTFEDGHNLSNWTLQKIEETKLHSHLLSSKTSVLYTSGCMGRVDNFNWKYLWTAKVEPICPISQVRSGGFREPNSVLPNSYLITGADDFKRVEGGKSQFKLSSLKLFKETARASAKAAKINDPNYAGDVQRCIVEARNTIKEENATGSLLSGIASVAGLGDVAGAIDTFNTAASAYDNLSGREKNLTDQCMRRNGHQ